MGRLTNSTSRSGASSSAWASAARFKDAGHNHWRPPLIDDLERVNITRVESHSHQAEMLTEDENIVAVNLTVQYRRSDPIDYVIKVKNPVESLVDATESALRHVVGGSQMESVLTEGRLAMGQEVEERIQRYLDDYEAGIEVVTVNIDDSAPPDPVQAAFDDVQKAKEDKDRAVNDADAYAATVVPEARGEAAKAVQEARRTATRSSPKPRGRRGVS